MTPEPVLAIGFLQLWQVNPVYFVSWVVTVIVSIVLHELGHGVAAIWQGDDTPKVTGHMTLNPLVHMGGVSLIALFLAGIAWGMMPVDPSRFRSKFGDALVSAAGPLVNLLLALIGLTVLGVLVGAGTVPHPPDELGTVVGTRPGTGPEKALVFLTVFGTANLVLFLLNLIPLPPLDGSRVVANFVRPYKTFVSNPNNQGVFFVVLIAFIFMGPNLFSLAYKGTLFWVGLLAG